MEKIRVFYDLIKKKPYYCENNIWFSEDIIDVCILVIETSISNKHSTNEN